jgi:hypothetical protein
MSPGTAFFSCQYHAVRPKKHMLLNLVKVRYGNAPVFPEVFSVEHQPADAFVSVK